MCPRITLRLASRPVPLRSRNLSRPNSRYALVERNMNLIETVMSFWFWLSAAGILYAYLIYPIIIYVLSRVVGKAPSPPHIPDEDLPRVALLITAHNEAAVIEQRIQNAL